MVFTVVGYMQRRTVAHYKGSFALERIVVFIGRCNQRGGFI